MRRIIVGIFVCLGMSGLTMQVQASDPCEHLHDAHAEELQTMQAEQAAAIAGMIGNAGTGLGMIAGKQCSGYKCVENTQRLNQDLVDKQTRAAINHRSRLDMLELYQRSCESAVDTIRALLQNIAKEQNGSSAGAAR